MTDNKLWISHVANEFFPIWEKRLELIDDIVIKPISNNFYSIQFPSPPNINVIQNSIFSRYWFSVDYMWPTKTNEKGFIEKCAQGITKKFLQNDFQNIIVFSADRKQQTLASNLRGRLLQTLKENILTTRFPASPLGINI